MIRLGRLCRNAGGSLSSSGLITILFMDLVGATEFASDIGDAAADEHFAPAIALCERAGVRANLARCHLAWARVFVVRGETHHAGEHAEIAAALGDELGMDGKFGIVPRGRALLEAL
ncbi:MAG: hypothetical protein QOI55_2949 [Actinomycetota bacterium]|nr:hypothetical protein [Actinomycetota bacterium]